jgi:hypothetical protein
LRGSTLAGGTVEGALGDDDVDRGVGHPALGHLNIKRQRVLAVEAGALRRGVGAAGAPPLALDHSEVQLLTVGAGRFGRQVGERGHRGL